MLIGAILDGMVLGAVVTSYALASLVRFILYSVRVRVKVSIGVSGAGLVLPVPSRTLTRLLSLVTGLR